MLAYPLTISPNGGLALSSDPTRDQILSLINCLFYERVMFTGFGTNITVFDPIDADSVGQLVASLQLSLNYWIGVGCTVDIQPTDIEAGTIILIITHPQSLSPILFNYSEYLTIEATQNASTTT